MAYAVVKGERLRVTRTNKCGLPLEGAANRLVTEGFIEIALNPEMKAAEELETTNAAGKVCVSDRTPAERKRWNISANLCDVDPDLWSLLAQWARILDYEGKPIGVRDRKSVDADSGVMIELWTGGEGSDDCPVPTDDSIFSTVGSGRNYGYLAFLGTEFVADGLTVNAQPSTFTFNGITAAPKQWGRGPYNVAGIDGNGTPGRLLTPIYNEADENHLALFRTPVAPPPVTDGAVPLDLSGFDDPDFYFGGPANEPAADVAPAQLEAGQGYELTITGGPSGGTFSLIAEYPGQLSKETATIAYNANAAAVKSALVALDDGYAAGDWEVTGGTALPSGTITIVPPQGVVVVEGDNDLTGGTDPEVSVDPV
ncbi:major tail protein [Mycobacterium phage Argie]|nr:major tail protein [Mycobacterium phage Argie]